MWSGSQALLQTISCMKVVGRLCAGGQAVVESQHRFEENVIKFTKSTWVKAHNVYLIQIFSPQHTYNDEEQLQKKRIWYKVVICAHMVKHWSVNYKGFRKNVQKST